MAVRPPSKDELAATARGYGMKLTNADLDSFGPVVAGALASYDAVEDLYAASTPATSVPAGLADGLPAGLMIVGRHFEDTTCLRVAQAFETLTGGFPTPPEGA